VLQLFSATANAVFPDVNKRSRLSRLSRFLRLAATPETQRYATLMLQGSADLRRQLFGERLQMPHVNNAERFICQALQATTTGDPDERFAECDLHTYLVNDIFVKVDRASMANGLEVRSPFLDKEVLEFAAKLPFEYKQQGSLRKRILKQAMANDLLPEVVTGRKRGFAVPLAQWFRTTWRGQLEMHLREGKAVKNNYLNAPALEILLKEHHQCRRDHSELIGNLLMLELFLENEI
jgi:asparagine synthase (glutamine-hydrolysing)